MKLTNKAINEIIQIIIYNTYINYVVKRIFI